MNKYRDIGLQMRDDEAGAQAATIQMAADTTPEQEAGWASLAERTGAPIGAVRADPEGAQLAAQRREMASLSPVTQRWLTENPNRYALVKDEIGDLDKLGLAIRRSFQASRDTGLSDGWRTWSDHLRSWEDIAETGEAAFRASPDPFYVEELGTALFAGYERALGNAALVGGLDMRSDEARARGETVARGLGFESDEAYQASRRGSFAASQERRAQQIERTSEATDRQFENIAAANEADSLWEAIGLVARSPRAVGTVVTQSLGMGAPGLALTAATGGMGRLATAGTAGSSSGWVEYGASISESLADAGVDVTDPAAVARALRNPQLMGEARERAAKRSVPIALFDAATAGLAGQLLINARRSAVSAASRTAGEMGIQAAGGSLGELTAGLVAGEGVQWGDVLLEGIAEVPFGAVEARANYVTARERGQVRWINEQLDIVRRSSSGSDALSAATIAAGNANLGRRSASEAQSFAQAAGAEGGVYIDAEAARTLFQENWQTLVDAVGGDTALTEQLASGDVMIPADQYFARIAQLPNAQDIARNARTQADALSAVELEQFDIDALADAMAGDTADAAARAAPGEGPTTRQRVQDDVYGQLIATDRYTDAAAEAQAKLWGAFFGSLENRYGVDGWALYESRIRGIRSGRADGAPDPRSTRPWMGEGQLDAVLDSIRSGADTDPRTIYGPSLTEFLRGLGGVVDTGGDMRSMDAGRQRIGLINAQGVPLDRARELAAEAGYFGGDPAAAMANTTIADLLELVDRDLRSGDVFSDQQADQARLQFSESRDQVLQAISENEYLRDMPQEQFDALTNQQIADILFGGASMDQVEAGRSRRYPLPNEQMETAPVGAWVQGPEVPGVTGNVFQVRDVPLDRITGVEFDSSGNLIENRVPDAERYAEAMRAGDRFPNLRGYELDNGIVQVMDGHRRITAARMAGLDSIPVAVLPADDALNFDQPAFHGTPHDVDRFSLHRIGQGEGYQAYGWGLYFASEREVAEHYRRSLAGTGPLVAMEVNPDGTVNRAAQIALQIDAGIPQAEIIDAMGDVEDSLSAAELQALFDEGQALYDEVMSRGNVYQVEVPDNSDLIDYDRPLREQSPEVIAALEPYIADAATRRQASVTRRMNSQEARESVMRGLAKDAYADMVQVHGSPRAASEYLRSLGIPGLRYLDGASRADGDGSHNFVIWDEAAIGDPVRLNQEAVGQPDFQIPDRLRELWSEYDETGVSTIEDLADYLDLIDVPPAVDSALRDFNESRREEYDEWGGRGDMYGDGDTLGDAVKAWLEGADQAAPQPDGIRDTALEAPDGFIAPPIAAPSPNETWFHGRPEGAAQDFADGRPAFFTRDESGADWYAQGGGQVRPFTVRADNPARVRDLQETLQALGYGTDPNVDARLADAIAANSTYEGTNLLDAVYIPEVREALEAAGFDSVLAWDTLESSDIQALVVWNPEQVQQEAPGFDESAFRPEVVAWAKHRFGEVVAPNGNPAWQNFVAWFGDSQVVDEQGRPRVVHHGGTAQDVFDTERGGGGVTQLGPGSYFGPIGIAEEWVDMRGEGQVGDYYLSLKAPFDETRGWSAPAEMTERLIESLVARGLPRAQVQASVTNPGWGELTQIARELAQITGQSTWQAAESINADIRAAGFDGIIADWKSGDQQFVAFSPEQIKSATANTGNFDPAQGSVLNQSGVDSPAFYSAALRTIEEGRGAPRRADAKAWKGWLDGAQRRGEMRQAERDWLGIDTWLDEQDGPITREQLAEFVRANQVQIEEVTLGEGVDSSLPEGWRVVPNEDGDGFELLDADGVMRGEGATEAAAIADGQDRDERGEAGAPRYSEYQLPGGQNYRELLLTLPASGPDPVASMSREELGAIYEDEIGYNPAEDDPSITTEELRQMVRDLAPGAAQAQETLINRQISTAYHSPHFDQPNILAHVRFNERTDADGNRVLFIEEIQSDWHQEGRKQGYARPDTPDAEVMQLLDAEGYSARNNGANWVITAKNGGPVPNKLAGGTADSQFAANLAQVAQMVLGRTDLRAKIGATPDAPFKATDEWAMLAFKRMVRHAVENGFERIAWTTGEQQAARYDLSKQVRTIDYNPSSERLFVRDIDGAVIYNEVTSPESIPDVIGKEAAERLLSQPRVSLEGGTEANWQRLEGDGLRMGGEGMRAFYDNILPKAVNKWAKKLGGRVGQAWVKTSDARQADADLDLLAELGHEISGATRGQDVGADVHALDITDKMRDAALQGMTLFQSQVDELVATHNLSGENVMHALRIGGLAVPSLAITRQDQSLTGFGDITLIGDRNIIDPRQGARAFGADIYSPRYPEVTYRLNGPAVRHLNEVTGHEGGWQQDITAEDLSREDSFRDYMAREFGEDWTYSQATDEAARLLIEAGADERIFQGFTPSGNRRYTPHTLENVIRILKKELRGGESFNYGTGSLRAKFTPQFRSVKAIKEASDKLQTREAFEAAKQEVENELFAIAEELKPFSTRGERNSFMFTDTVIDMIGDSSNGQLARQLQEYGFENVPQETAQRIVNFMQTLREMPTEYFEVKQLRAVGIDEFRAAAVPDDADPEVIAALRENGLEVVEYPAGDEDARRQAVATIAHEQALLFQRGQQSPRGQIQIYPDRGMSISLFESADRSTFLHESGHFFLEVFKDMAALQDAPEQVRDDMTALLEWFGVESADQIGVEQHEQFARGFEKYLGEGRAPSPELQSVFSQFKAWLLSIYRDLVNLNVNLTDDVRGVMDRMLASEAEIEAAHVRQGMEPMDFGEGVLEAEQIKQYADQLTQATERERAALAARLMAAHDRAAKRWYREQRAEVRKEVEAEYAAMPVYRAARVLAGARTFADGEGIPSELQGMKLDKAALVAVYGEEYLARIRGMYRVKGGVDQDLAAMRLGFESGDALVTALANREDMDARVEAETDERMRERHGDPMTDGTLAERAMDAVHGDHRMRVLAWEMAVLEALAADPTAAADIPRPRRQEGEQEAPAAQEGGQQAQEGQQQPQRRQISPETRERIQQAQARRTAATRALAEAARRAIAGKKLRDIRPHDYLAAERKAARKATAAAAGGRYVEGLQAKRQQAFNAALYREAMRVQKRADSNVRFLRRASSDQTRARIGKQAGKFYVDALDAIFDGIEVRGASRPQVARRAALREWVARMQEEGNSTAVPDMLLARVEAENVTNLADMTVGDVEGLREAVENILHLARVKNRLQTAKGQREWEDVKAEMMERLQEQPDRHGRHGISDADRRLIERIGDLYAAGSNWVLQPETMVEWLDGATTGPFHDLLWDMAQAAERKREALNRQVGNALQEAMAEMPAAERKALDRRFHIESLGGDVSGHSILSALLNMGNEGNRDKLLRGGRVVGDEIVPFTEQQLADMFGRLTRPQAEVVQKVWDAIDQLWPEIVALEESMNGITPEKVEASQFTVMTRDGAVNLRGGYYPVMYDPKGARAGQFSEDEQAKRVLSGQTPVRASTSKGHIEKRTEFVAPLLLDYHSVITRHLDGVIGDISYRQFLRQVYKVLGDSDIRRMIDNRLGPGAATGLRQSFERGAVGYYSLAGPLLGPFQKVADAGMTNLSSAALGFRIPLAMANVVAVPLQAMARVQKRHILRGLRDYYLSGGPNIIGNMRRNAEMVQRLSPLMLRRAEARSVELSAIISNLRGKRGFRSKMIEMAMAMHQWTVPLAENAVWMGAYQQAQAGGAGIQEAIAAADKAIRQTQTKTSAAELSRGEGGPMRMFMQFAGPLVIMNNRLQEAGLRGLRGDVHSWPQALGVWFAVAMGAAWSFELMMGRGPEGDDGEDADVGDWTWWAAQKLLLLPFAAFPLIRDVASYADSGFSRGTPLVEAALSIYEATVGTAQELFSDEEVNVEKIVKSQVRASGAAVGVPSNQLLRTGDYLMSVATGEHEMGNPAAEAYYLVQGAPDED